LPSSHLVRATSILTARTFFAAEREEDAPIFDDLCFVDMS